jgi:hypothetical protein
MLNDFIGRRETGKTTLVIYLARQGNAPRLMFDPRNMIYPRGGGVKVYSAEDLIDEALPALVSGETREVIYAPRDQGTRAAFRIFSEAVFTWIDLLRRSQLSVVIDESALVQDDIEDDEHPIRRAMISCERKRVHFFLTCHQPKNIPTNARAITDYLVFFRCTQEHDLKVIRERCSEAFAEAVSRLAPLQFKIWDDQIGAALPAEIPPERWKVDLGELESLTTISDQHPAVLDLGNLWA